MKDTKYIRRDFHSVTWVMPQGWGTGVPRGSKNYWGYHGGWGSKRFFSEIQPEMVCELLT